MHSQCLTRAHEWLFQPESCMYVMFWPSASKALPKNFTFHYVTDPKPEKTRFCWFFFSLHFFPFNIEWYGGSYFFVVVKRITVSLHKNSYIIIQLHTLIQSCTLHARSTNSIVFDISMVCAKIFNAEARYRKMLVVAVLLFLEYAKKKFFPQK